MPLHPQCRKVIEMAAAAGGGVFAARTPDEARRIYAAGTAAYAPPTPELRAVEDREMPGPAGPIPLRLYRPQAPDGALPILMFFHGGGWVFGDRDTHDAVCRILAHEAGCLVISVDYRLAPEHRFPAAVEDSFAATAWAAANAGSFGGDAGRLAVGGDSAGGNLAAAVSQLARDRDGPRLAFQLLIYPAVDLSTEWPSVAENAEGYLLTRDGIRWTKTQYLPDEAAALDPRASPLLARDLAGLPPALVQTAEYDPLRDEGKAYADKLSAADVPVDYRCYPGMVHGFIRMGALIEPALPALRDGAAALRRAFAR